MTWLNSWIVRQGTVSVVERGKPWHRLTDLHDTMFLIGSNWVRFRGPRVPFAPGDRVVLVGWRFDYGIEAGFVVLPDKGELFQPYRGGSMLVFGMFAFILAAVLLVNGFWGAGIVMAGLCSALVFHSLAWRSGYRLVRSYLPARK